MASPKKSKTKKDAPAIPNLKPPRFPVVGIGASAGGLVALEQFFEAVPADCGLAFVVVTHQRAEYHSLLTDILQKKSGCPFKRPKTARGPRRARWF